MGCGCGGNTDNNKKKLKSVKDINNWNKHVAKKLDARGIVNKSVEVKAAEAKALIKAQRKAKKLEAVKK